MNHRRPGPAAASDGVPAGSRPLRHRRGHIAFLVLAMVACAGFTALGIWQVQRLGWKHDLIARVEARIHAEPAPPPAAAQWPDVNERDHEYLRIRLDGRWLAGDDVRVQAVTRLGAGWWLLRPLRTDAGDIVLVNRGFVPDGAEAEPMPATAGQAADVTGLLRMDEPRGGFLRRNDPVAGRWYSRDVQAIAAAAGLGRVAPFFIDADHMGAPGQWPAGGLTVTRFADNHLPYALTWFTLALLSAGGAWRLLREPGRRSRTQSEDTAHAAERRKAKGSGA